MQTKIACIVFIAMLFLANCSAPKQPNKPEPNTLASSPTLPAITTGARPNWSKTFPRNQFVSVVGKGDDALRASENARQHMANLLNPQPEANNIDQLNAKIKIAALWLKENGNYHALAIFPQAAAATHLWQKITTLDAMTSQNMATLEASTDPLKKIGLLIQAIKRQQLRAAYQKSLKQVDLKGEGRESPWNTRQWSLDIEKHLSALLITPKDGPSAELKTLQKGLSHAGITPATKNMAQYTLETESNIVYKDVANGWSQAKGTFKVRLRNKPQATTQGEKIWHIETSALSTAAAKQRVERKTKYIIEKQMREIIKAIALSTVQ